VGSVTYARLDAPAEHLAVLVMQIAQKTASTLKEIVRPKSAKREE
jgi:hypothetical protein